MFVHSPTHSVYRTGQSFTHTLNQYKLSPEITELWVWISCDHYTIWNLLQRPEPRFDAPSAKVRSAFHGSTWNALIASTLARPTGKWSFTFFLQHIMWFIFLLLPPVIFSVYFYSKTQQCRNNTLLSWVFVCDSNLRLTPKYEQKFPGIEHRSRYCGSCRFCEAFKKLL